MAASVVWRPAAPEHYPAIGNLTKTAEQLFLVYPRGHFPWDVAQLEELARKRLNLTIGVVDGEVAAFANLYNVQPGERAFIGNVVVAEQHRGRGVGRALVQQMVAICEEQHRAQPHLSVFGYNAAAMLLYADMGFEPYAVEPFQSLSGERVALIHMRYRHH